MRLVDRLPQLDAAGLLPRFHPPHRFEDVRFETYRPDPQFSSQADALVEMRRFASSISAPGKRRRFWHRRAVATEKAGRYLDGGYGVGKTHLLASLWHASPGPKYYVTFAELTAFIGFLGMSEAVQSFENFKLLCIDEFELDDVANTLMVVSFLRGVMSQGMRLAVTSNTLPDRLGEKRFSASEFKREIAAIADHFEEVRIDGGDFRAHSAPLPLADLDPDSLDHRTHDEFEHLLVHLSSVHPVQYGALFDEVDAVVIDGMRPIDDQDTALRWVHFVDKAYDARIPVRISGCAVENLFSPAFRNGGYRKKYGRAESRLTAMEAESAGLIH